ncbi:HET-domain-containing protein [Daldinia eschscholtzii]|nr:HET-domain-containing protein [Daldinia eschscholtzii]
MGADVLGPPKRCLVCGARSNDLSTAWSNPEYAPHPYLVDWRVDFDSVVHSPTFDFGVGCVVCATVLSILAGTYKPRKGKGPNSPYHYPLNSKFNSVGVNMGECGTIVLDIPGQESILINQLVPLTEPRYEPYYNFPTSKGSIETFKLARRWLDLCKTNHKECILTLEPYIPSRLIDVSSWNAKLLLRCEVPKESPFVALSHCWGGSQPLKTTTSNIESHRIGIAPEDLPATFRDAVIITKTLGLRFLWIDSLCIIQDDKDDWEQESSQMEKIYGRADVRLDSKSPPVESIYRVASDHINHRDEPLDYRAWAFQERLMAQRFLSFGTREMMWTCRTHSLCECGWVSFQPSHPNKLNLEDMLGLLSHWGLTTLWVNNIVIPYTRRKLTIQSDKLVALSAVASRFKSYYGGTYLAGLWEEDLVYGLLWMTKGGKPENFEAPSWSWISVNSNCFSYNMWAKFSAPLVKVRRVSVELSTKNIYGPVSGGSIQLLGRAVRGNIRIDRVFRNLEGKCKVACDISGTPWAVDCWLDMPLTPYGSILNHDTGRTEVSARRVYFEERQSCPETVTTCSVWILLMAAKNKSDEYNGLILGPSPKQSGCFERLGLACWPSERLPCKWVIRHKTRKFTII